MSLLRKTLVATGIVLLLLMAVGFLLPRHVRVEREVVVRAPRAAVFDTLNGFSHFNRWSPWAELDPQAKYGYEGPPSGVGSRMTWVGDPATMGSGSQEILAVDPPSRIRVRYEFGTQRAEATFDLTEQGRGTRVVWGLETDLGNNPIGRYFGLMFDGMIGRDFERGLARLKDHIESLSASGGRASRP